MLLFINFMKKFVYLIIFLSFLFFILIFINGSLDMFPTVEQENKIKEVSLFFISLILFGSALYLAVRKTSLLKKLVSRFYSFKK